MAKNEIRINITGDTTRFGGALDKAQTKMAAFSAKMKAVGAKMKSVGKSMSLGITLPIVGALGLGVKWAGELEDAQAASEQVFGAMASDMDKWADNAAKNFGLSKGDATEWAAQVGIRLKSIGGMSEEAAAGWSQNLVQLGGDFASFFGGTTEEAVTAINSALTGEMEPLKRYGVIINDASLKAHILATTGEEVTGTLTAQQKQMATLGLITASTGDIQGDYARNADGATNAQRTMTASLKDAATTLGTVLLPYVTKAVGFVTKLAEKFQNLSPNIQKFAVIALLAVAVIGPLLVIFGTLATAIGAIGLPVILVVAAIAALVAGLVWLYFNVQGFRDFVDTVVDGAVAIYNAIVDFITAAIPVAQQAFADFQNGLRVVGEVAGNVAAWLNEHVGPLFAAAGELILAIAGAMKAGWEQAWAVFGPVVKTAVAVIMAAINFFGPTIKAAWRGIWTFIQTLVSTAWNTIRGVVEGALSGITALFKFFSAILKGDWGAAWDALKNIVSSSAAVLKSLVDGIARVVTGAMKLAGTLAVNAFKAGWQFLSSVISGSIGAISGAIGSVVSAITGAFSGASGWLTSAGRAIMDGLLSGIKAAYNKVKNFVSGIAGTIKGLKGPIEKDRVLLLDEGQAIMEGLGLGIRKGLADVESLVSDIAPSINADVSSSAATSGFTSGSAGANYYITVNAGMGTDGSEVGREIVDALSSYERHNGVGWRN